MKYLRQVLIAEDNLADLKLIQSAFDEIDLQAEIIIIKDGQELLNFFENNSVEDLGLLLLDLNLPSINGMDIIHKFYNDEFLKMVPIVVFTALEDDKKIVECYEHGANACIRKPSDINEFSRIIRAISNFWLEINVLPTLRPLAAN